jgi:uncharacterized damage-inducible protein DinB
MSRGILARREARPIDIWRHLFVDGEFASRGRVLTGLSLEHVSARPAGAPHSIYQELHHAATWQRLTLDQDEAALDRWEESGADFPASPAPEDEAAWQKLMRSFLSDLERAVRLGSDETLLDTDERENNPGFTWRHALECLAVHNAYHLGKIVLLRQLLGVWSPPEDARA